MLGIEPRAFHLLSTKTQSFPHKTGIGGGTKEEKRQILAPNHLNYKCSLGEGEEEQGGM